VGVQVAKRRDVKRLILEAARKRFLADGFRKTTIEAIASDFSVSKKTVYKLFDSKEAIWVGLVHQDALMMVEYLKTHLSPTLPPLTRLEKLIVYYLKRLGTGAKKTNKKYTDNENENLTQRLREEALQQAFPILVEELICEAQTDTEKEKEVPTRRSMLLTAMVVGAVTGAAFHTPLDNEQIATITSTIHKMVAQ